LFASERRPAFAVHSLGNFLPEPDPTSSGDQVVIFIVSTSSLINKGTYLFIAPQYGTICKMKTNLKLLDYIKENNPFCLLQTCCFDDVEFGVDVGWGPLMMFDYFGTFFLMNSFIE
jgi:hypothetical protein